MPVTSAGLLVYRGDPTAREVLLAHMGGPFWQRKDAGAWTIPKGEFDPVTESALEAARREFLEELGFAAPAGPAAALGEFAASRKTLTIFAVEAGGLDISAPVFGEFEMEWPPRSGRRASFPEVDRVGWFGVGEAAAKLTASQRPVLEVLRTELGDREG